MDELLNNQKRKIVLSPHFDDLAISLGGLALKWAENNCEIEDWVIFSNCEFSIYYNPKNKNSKEIKKVISELRLQEERNAIKKIGNTKIKLCNQDEAPLRGHQEIYGRYALTKKNDRAVVNSLYKIILPLLFSEDAQIFVPLAIKEHIDHLIVRNLVMNIILKNKNKIKAQVFFYEDLPYVASVNKKELKQTNKFIKENRLMPITYPIDLKSKLEILQIYKSQPINHYYEAIIQRTRQIQKQENRNETSEKIYQLLLQPALFKNRRSYSLEIPFLLSKIYFKLKSIMK